MSRTRRSRHAVGGLTLFEVIISIALIAMLLGSLLTFFWQSIAIRDHAAHSSARIQIVQQMLGRIAAELRDSIGVEKVGFNQVTHFTGGRRQISFLTSPLPPSHSYAFYRELEGSPAPRHDLVEVTYELWIDPKKTTEDGNPLVGGILRTERHVLNPSADEEELPVEEDLLYRRHDLWSYELGYLEFRYFDGVEWSTNWQVTEGDPLPHLVQITIGFESITRDELDDQDLRDYPIDQYPLGSGQPQPSRYSLIVRLPAADELFSARLHRISGEATEVYTFGGEGETESPGTGGTP